MSEPTLPPLAPPTAFGLSVRTALTMLAFTMAFTALMAGTYLATRDTIDASAEQEKLRLINDILPPVSYDNALLRDAVTLDTAPELGLPKGATIWRARKGDAPVALVMEAVAPDGYSGKIRLVLAVMHDGSLGGVRVVEHRETPGLGDYIDPKKDKNKTAPWIGQFAALAGSDWKVRKDGGAIEYRAGATISARAVTNAVARAAAFARADQDRLFRQGVQP
ncbi:MAG: electron transporter RnfG [Candidatus Dactylopiibacterium carminicum]|uniref:Ion-translocating oxidoreductase complex subunit G n=1 Tax=Candidatus Dactylopiibacterium carminicum TaxID=857335 RepID=A0A272EVG2_9RHOO|nr:RnfABCDGE type electron transport complex subunit G [Candidatus Dactylopiibacterium carminicum]KAF7598179.1 electron transporter RnfG [Candidatus Dactylopiibacterium carminicum]PAS94098.1 MAG: electron transporter RnfG [Candidatus Dactylopiibacterium carminicum]PAS96866.1 MAG: electron transporter RnfG [Candidatus Dactylopiibacterium carminicum]